MVLNATHTMQQGASFPLLCCVCVCAHVVRNRAAATSSAHAISPEGVRNLRDLSGLLPQAEPLELGGELPAHPRIHGSHSAPARPGGVIIVYAHTLLLSQAACSSSRVSILAVQSLPDRAVDRACWSITWNQSAATPLRQQSAHKFSTGPACWSL